MKFSQNYGGVVLGWGTIGQQGAFYMTINSDLLLYYKREYKALMLLRAEYANIDRMTDTAIEQSEFYTITGGIMNIGFPLPRPYTNLHLQMSQPTTVLFVLAIVPTISTHDQIKSISDINRIGGEIVATPSATVRALP
jgi:hypothetical protein